MLQLLKFSSRNPFLIFILVIQYNSIINKGSLVLSFKFPIKRTGTGEGPPCESEIYCHGRLLHAIQMAHAFSDSKTFVDMKQKYPEADILKNFDDFMDKHLQKPSKSSFKQFVDDNFDDVGSEFEKWTPADWKKQPKFVKQIEDETAKNWMLYLHGVWKQLGRKMKADVLDRNDLYSIIWVPNPVVVPGGRFREFYYWDSYWIINGLLISEMVQTARGMLENYIFLVQNYGKIPNGGRKYYFGRSQPPLFIPMVQLFYDYTKNNSFIKKNINDIEKEYEFWMTEHTKNVKIKGKEYTVAFYGDKSVGPRPESYREDVETASSLKTEEKRIELYSELKAAAASGWDFSTRWFVRRGSNKGTLVDLKTKEIIPTDLNSALCGNANILANLFSIAGNQAKSEEYKKKYQVWKSTVQAVHWHDDVGSWLDYDTINNKRRNYFYPANFFPMWTECYDQSKTYIADKILNYIKKNDVVDAAGIPTSFEDSGEQWDYRNTWPPLQHMVIMGLDKTGVPKAQKLARKIARKWIKANYMSYMITGHMYEKYDSSQLGVVGRGGEYEVQLGFGWTNGVIMDLIMKYGRSCGRSRFLGCLSPLLFVGFLILRCLK